MPLSENPLVVSNVLLGAGVAFTLWGFELWSGAPRVRKLAKAFLPGLERLRDGQLRSLVPTKFSPVWSRLAGGTMGLGGLAMVALGGLGLSRFLGPGSR